MGLVQLGGVDVIRGTVMLPRTGVWHADLLVDKATTDGLTGKQNLTVGGSDLTLSGSAYRIGEFKDAVHVRFVAGAAGLSANVNPKAYSNVPLKIPLNDVLQGAGETLSTTADQPTLNAQLNAWSTMALPAGEMVDELIAAAPAGTTWRFLADGTFWCGPETWPTNSIAYQLIDSEPELGRIKIATDEPTLLPGQALDLGNVSYVEHHITHDRVRTIAWLESTAPTGDRVKGPWTKFVKAIARKIDRFGFYRAKVISQSGQTFDVLPDDPRLPRQGYSKVPLRNGLPALTVQVAAGAYVLIGFQGGDASKPFVHCWEGGETVTSLQLAGSDPVATQKDLKALMNAISTAATAVDNSGSTFKSNIIANLGTAGWAAAAGDGKCGSGVVGAGR